MRVGSIEFLALAVRQSVRQSRDVFLTLRADLVLEGVVLVLVVDDAGPGVSFRLSGDDDWPDDAIFLSGSDDVFFRDPENYGSRAVAFREKVRIGAFLDPVTVLK